MDPSVPPAPGAGNRPAQATDEPPPAVARTHGSAGNRRYLTKGAAAATIEPGVVPSRPVTLTFPTFDHAADQAGRSRRYGGIHFEAGDLDGRRLGRRVGASAWAKAQRYFDGTAVDPVG
jgi:hypothetical protein